MSESNIEVDLEIRQNVETEIADPMEGYAAEQARKYAEEAEIAAKEAKEARNIAEAWAESENAPTVLESRSSKTWSEISKEWAEGENNPGEIEGSRSAKSWAEASAESAIAASQSECSAADSATVSVENAFAAVEAAKNATNSETSARQSAASAADKLAQMRINLTAKANVESPELTGEPTAPTPDMNAQGTQIANVSYVLKKISELIDSSPEALDTLSELAAALGNDPNFATTVMDAIGNKLDKMGTAASATKAVRDGDGRVITSTYATKVEVSEASDALAVVATSGDYNDLINKPVENSDIQITESTQVNINPSVSSGMPSSYGITVPNVVSGIAAGTYKLKVLLQNLVNMSHAHEAVYKNGSNCVCDCDCNCQCSD